MYNYLLLAASERSMGMGIVLAMVIVSVVGLLIGIFLGIAGKKFYVEVDPRETAILECLPGNNCGGCGYAGCSGLAAAIVKGEAPVNGCPVGGAPIGAAVGEIMGIKAEEGVKKVAFVKCKGNKDVAATDYHYIGIKDCGALRYVPGGGPKTCNYGCLGFGSCVSACPFDAIHIVDGTALVDEEACKACGKCVAACPKGLIELVPYHQPHKVECSSHGKGKAVMDACSAGCIGCGLCVKNCPAEAITITDNIPHIDYEKCTKCGICKEKCPKKVIL